MPSKNSLYIFSKVKKKKTYLCVYILIQNTQLYFFTFENMLLETLYQTLFFLHYEYFKRVSEYFLNYHIILKTII